MSLSLVEGQLKMVENELTMLRMWGFWSCIEVTLFLVEYPLTLVEITLSLIW